MRIGVYGAGGVGGYFGARLAASGRDVRFVARGAHLAAMRETGLRVSSPKGDVTVLPVQASDDPAELGPVDVVLVAVKTWQLSEVLEGLPPLLEADSVVLPLLNGVEAADELAAVVGKGRVLKGLCRIISMVEAPGHVRHLGAEPSIVLGEWDNERTDRVNRLRDVLAGAGIGARVPDDIDVALWEKFAFVVSVGGVGAVTRAPIGQERSHPATRGMIESAIREIVRVGQASGVAIGEGVVEKSMSFVDTLPAHGSASLQRDLAAGRLSELEAWNGAVVRLGRQVGVETPIHDVIYASLVLQEDRARGERRFDTPGVEIDPFRERYLAQTAERFRWVRDLAEQAIAQTADEDFFRRLDPDANSIALLVKHLAGNHRSRWTDFLTSDGEKPDRNRDAEFEPDEASRDRLMAAWSDGWRGSSSTRSRRCRPTTWTEPSGFGVSLSPWWPRSVGL
jgi:2-dehydropantoate 2-reductase